MPCVLVHHWIGEGHAEEPDLYLWGIRVTDDSFRPWDLLIAARERFESTLPVDRPLTEPDIALHLPGRYLILIEAKFTAQNRWYNRGPRFDKESLTLEELIEIYSDDQLQLLSVKGDCDRDRIYYQLWRNTIFAEWIARQDSSRTKAFHINLVRKGYDESSAREFSSLISSQYSDRFRQCYWEDVYRWLPDLERLNGLRSYMRQKTANLRAALRLRG